MINWINTPVIITTRKIPRLKTRWKWLEKLFGYKSYDVQEVGKIIIKDDGAYMTETDYEFMKDVIPSSEQIILDDSFEGQKKVARAIMNGLLDEEK